MLMQAPHHRSHPDGAAPQHQLGTPTIALIVAAVVAIAVGGRFLTHRLDRGRIDSYARGKGWRLESCSWRLFGPGWFGSQRERIYEIRYRDGDGRLHAAFAKTSALAGVYLSEDRVIEG